MPQFNFSKSHRGGGGHSRMRCVQSCDRGQDAIKQSSDVLGHYLQHCWRSRGVGECLCMRSWSLVNRSRAKIRCGQAVKAINFFNSQKILTAVAALDTAPMGVPPPLLIYTSRFQHVTLGTVIIGYNFTALDISLLSLGTWPALEWPMTERSVLLGRIESMYMKV